ncbi:hypothetical protein A2U01_0088600, partial [Trifolium medium]|nr:hypothetical protein [Trifolium medium]
GTEGTDSSKTEDIGGPGTLMESGSEVGAWACVLGRLGPRIRKSDFKSFTFSP